MAVGLLGFVLVALLLIAGAAVVILGGVWLFDRNRKPEIPGGDE